MPSLRDFQHDFLNRLSGDAEGKMRIYKNNRDLILRDILKGVYPITTILLGDEFMHQACAAFIEINPPDSGDMNGYGDGFAAFLDRLPSLRSYPYVPDIAKLEWFAHEAYLSPVEPALTAQDLENVADPLNMQLHLQPHAFLLRSGWPVDKLWARVSEEGASLKDFALQSQETFIALYRKDKKITVLTLSEGAYVFLEHLQTNPAFAFAAEAALRAESDLKLEFILARCVQAGLFARC